jgi:hypothetical protein
MSIFDEDIIKKEPVCTIFRYWEVAVDKINNVNELWSRFNHAKHAKDRLDKFQHVENFFNKAKCDDIDIFERIHIVDRECSTTSGRIRILRMMTAYILQDINWTDLIKVNTKGSEEYCNIFREESWRFENYNKTVRKITQRIREWFDVPQDIHIKIEWFGYYNTWLESYIFNIDCSMYKTNRREDIQLFRLNLYN